MAAGDNVLLKKFNKEQITAIDASSGTYCWVALKCGQIARFTISGATLTYPARFRGKINCIYCNNTTMYLGMNDGRLLSWTVAGIVHSELKRFDSAITSISVLSTLIYVGTADGRLHTYQIS